MAGFERTTLGSLMLNFVAAASGIASLVWLRLMGGFTSNSVYMYTIWTIFVQIITACTFLISDARSLLTKDVATKVKNGPKLQSKKDLNPPSSIIKFLLFHLAFVMTISTFLLFWLIHTIDPHALVPKQFYYPNLLNHMHHTLPFIFSAFHIVIFANNEIKTSKLNIGVMHANELGMPFVFFVNSLYSCFMIISSVVRGKWPYPFLNLLTRFQLCAFFVIGNILALMISNISNQVLFKIVKSLRAKNNAKKIK